jgi:subtilisin family serine protease
MWVVATCVAIVIGASGAPAEASPYDPSRIDPVLARQALASPDRQFDVILRAATDRARPAKSSPQRARDAVTRQHGRARFALGLIGGAAATVSGRDLIALSRDRDLAYIHRDAAIAASFDPLVDYAKVTSPAILETYANAVWQYYNVCGRGVTVAVVDSGVYPHPDLAGRIVAAIDLTQDPPVFSAGPLADPGGHGTHVAGLVAGDGTSSAGAYTGTAPCARIVDVRVLDASGRSTTSTVLRGLEWILANRKTYGIRVVNLSFGADSTGTYKLDPLSAAVEALTLSGITVVAAAGNAGPTYETIASPALDPFVIAVGALDDAGTAKPSDDTVATFSARGPSKFDKLAKPDLVAPGRRVVSLLAPGSTLGTLYPDRLVTATGAATPQYLRLSGTSMATPLVAGLIALLLEKEPALNPFQIKHRMKYGVRKLGKIAPVDAGTGLATALPLALTGDLVAEYPASRVADALAAQLFTALYGQTIQWLSLTYNGGVDSSGTSWSSVTWDNVGWDAITWDNVGWDSFNWDNVGWDNVGWDNVGWDTGPGALITIGSAPDWNTVD